MTQRRQCQVPLLAGSILKPFCLILAIFGHQYLAQAAQGFLVLAEPISLQSRQDGNQNGINANSNGPSFDGSSLLELSVNGFNPFALGQTLFPGIYQGASSDLSNYYKMLSNSAQNGYSGLQSGFNYMNDNSMNRFNNFQQGFTANYGEELFRKMYDMLSNPQQMCNQLAAQSQMSLNKVGQMPQQVSQQTGNSLNQMAQSSDSFLGSVGNMLSSKPASSMLSKLGNFGGK